MTKKELMEMIRTKKAMQESENATAKDNATASEVKSFVNSAQKEAPSAGIVNSIEKTPEQAEAEKVAKDAVKPVVDVDKDGISKNGGERDLVDAQAENEKVKSAVKDVINVTDRTYEEQAEVQAQLLKNLKEAVQANAQLKKDIVAIRHICKEALKAQKAKVVKESAEKTSALIESIIKIGENMEESMNAEIEAGKKNLIKVETTLKASNKLNKILREGLLNTRAAKKMVRYESSMAKLTKIAD